MKAVLRGSTLGSVKSTCVCTCIQVLSDIGVGTRQQKRGPYLQSHAMRLLDFHTMPRFMQTTPIHVLVRLYDRQASYVAVNSLGMSTSYVHL